MPTEEPGIREMVVAGTPFLDLLEHLKRRAGGKLSPGGFLRILQEEAGISFTRTRDIFVYFNPDMNPIAEPEVINERWQVLLAGWELDRQ
ncbi:hypothetical protein VA596_34465 [Amycolatopsis sp., V23-08]|uniref:Uncharacterized protein n=1 Tax=Amycolatopsis heterodermiae TaxID=3110235 RepID=A0ABU5RFZ9_9PSEU|nr:hypothetical protein [Amycolatopsis sp., V23-08]MEA5364679.1 hypothetical protein [Amycolatopsis sp., V23-08]